MQPPRASVIVPTLHAGDNLRHCLEALARQTFDSFETIVVDNSGSRAASGFADLPGVRIIANTKNVGFAQAVNQGIASSEAEFVCTLNDDAYAAENWLSQLIAACAEHPKTGMCASQIRLRNSPDRLDSAGLNIYGDGTTKQRGQGSAVQDYAQPSAALLPSACAALYRRSMLEEIGVFDADYFLYCEDADLGLRARLAGWACRYVPTARVDHDYSRSAGRASALKAYLVERNRLYTVCKVFPVVLWPLVPWHSLYRYTAHVRAAIKGRGLAAEFGNGRHKWWQLVLIVMSAHGSTLLHLPKLLLKRRRVQRTRVLGVRGFRELLRQHYSSAAEIAEQ